MQVKFQIKFQVWFWGKGRRGQCGQGDMLDRLQPAVISCLSKLGIQKVRLLFNGPIIQLINIDELNYVK
jgi:hypothetical protein